MKQKPLERSFALVRKELYSYKNTPLSYGIALFFLLFVMIWFFYFYRFFALNTASLRPFFVSFPIAFILIIPVITMKSWAEERKLGSIELLLTMPFSEWELVLGKFISAFIVLTLIVALTVPLPLTLIPLGRFDGGVIVAEYLGALLLGASGVSLGLLLSSLAKNQGGAFLSSATVLLVTMLLNQFTQSLSIPLWLIEVLNFFSLAFHFESFAKGIFDTKNAAFFILSTILFLFLNTRVLLFRKWS
jgi:ABC-2 type transport system permease protein